MTGGKQPPSVCQAHDVLFLAAYIVRMAHMELGKADLLKSDFFRNFPRADLQFGYGIQFICMKYHDI